MHCSCTLFSNTISLCRIFCLESIPGEFKNLSNEGTFIMLTHNMNPPNTDTFFRYIGQGYTVCYCIAHSKNSWEVSCNLCPKEVYYGNFRLCMGQYKK